MEIRRAGTEVAFGPEMYGMRGASVAVLDVRRMEKESEGLAGVKFYHCDVGDVEAVERAKEQIEKDVRRPQILSAPRASSSD